MEKLKRVESKNIHIRHGNGYVRVAKIDGDLSVILEIEVKSTNVGTAIRKESFMRQLTIILLMTVL